MEKRFDRGVELLCRLPRGLQQRQGPHEMFALRLQVLGQEIPHLGSAM